MGRKNHNPSIARRIQQDLKRGEPPEQLIPIAKSITDPYYVSLSLTYIASSNSLKSSKSEKLFKTVFSQANNVDQSWRRLELLGEISKKMKNIQDADLKETQYHQILKLISSEKGKNSKEFFVKNAKHFPSTLLESLLNSTLKLKGYEIESSKAIIRCWINQKPIEELITILSELKGEFRVKLLGYLHFQAHKSEVRFESSPLEEALKSADSEEMFRYLVRVSSQASDLELVESFISNLSPEKSAPIFIALVARADRKRWSQEANYFVSKAENIIKSIKDSEVKAKFESKLQITTDKIKGVSKKPPVPDVSMVTLPDSGEHTLGLYNTYGGNWNHPHYKAVFKASNLCSAFDLNLALIGFPSIESDRLTKEIRKEMRLSNDGYLSQLISKDRVRFFDNDIDESWAGSKIVTTANPDSNKLKKPEGKLCMIMGLGPKGLPKSYINNSDNHFEITGSEVAFETGTAMGAIAGHLHLMQ